MSRSRYTCRKKTSTDWSGKLREQWKAGRHCDGVISIGTETIPIQKCVLAAVSPYFSSLFSSDFKEKTQTMLDLSDTFCCPDTLKAIIHFIYRDRLIITENNIDTILQYSGILALNSGDIRESCLQFLLENLRLSNSLWTWILAITYQFNELGKLCEDVAVCRFKDTLIHMEDSVHMPVQHLKICLQNGMAKFCQATDFESFLATYIAYDEANRKNYKSGLMTTFYDAKEREQLDLACGGSKAEDYDESVIIQNLSGHEMFIYSLRDNQWYTTSQGRVKNPNWILTTMGIGEHFEHMLFTENNSESTKDELVNINTFRRTQLPSFPEEPDAKRQNMKSELKNVHTRCCSGELFALAWFICRPMGYVGFLNVSEKHSVHMYRLDITGNHWEHVKKVHETNDEIHKIHFPHINDERMFPFVLMPQVIQPYQLSTKEAILNKLKPYRMPGVCNMEWVVIGREDSVFLWSNSSEKTLQYNVSKNSWTSHNRLKLMPDEKDTGLKKQKNLALSKTDGMVYLQGTKSSDNRHFVSYDPWKKTMKELCPLPVPDEEGYELCQWQRTHRQFFTYLKPVSGVKSTKKLLDFKKVEKCMSAYKRRINNEPDIPEEDEEDEKVTFQFFMHQMQQRMEQEMRERMQEEMLRQMFMRSMFGFP